MAYGCHLKYCLKIRQLATPHQQLLLVGLRVRVGLISVIVADMSP